MSAVALENKTILVTGAAGFIGSNLVKRICEEVPSAKVVGIDSVNDYYDVALKEFRLNELSKYESFTFIKGNIANKEWTVVSGTGYTIIDGQKQIVRPGDVLRMPAGCKHTIVADTELQVIEVQMGKDISVHDKEKFELEL